jgi:uncharacterized protein HemX
MSLWNRRGQTGLAGLALLVALVALGVAVYTYVQVSQRVDMQGQLIKVEEIMERGRKEMADALRRLEEQIRGSHPKESPSGQ